MALAYGHCLSGRELRLHFLLNFMRNFFSEIDHSRAGNMALAYGHLEVNTQQYGFVFKIGFSPLFPLSDSRAGKHKSVWHVIIAFWVPKFHGFST